MSTTACTKCNKSDGVTPLSQCGKCKSVQYCNEVCQRDHWRFGGHREECARICAAAAATGDDAVQNIAAGTSGGTALKDAFSSRPNTSAMYSQAPKEVQMRAQQRAKLRDPAVKPSLKSINELADHIVALQKQQTRDKVPLQTQFGVQLRIIANELNSITGDSKATLVAREVTAAAERIESYNAQRDYYENPDKFDALMKLGLRNTMRAFVEASVNPVSGAFDAGGAADVLIALRYDELLAADRAGVKIRVRDEDEQRIAQSEQHIAGTYETLKAAAYAEDKSAIVASLYALGGFFSHERLPKFMTYAGALFIKLAERAALADVTPELVAAFAPAEDDEQETSGGKGAATDSGPESAGDRVKRYIKASALSAASVLASLLATKLAHRMFTAHSVAAEQVKENTAREQAKAAADKATAETYDAAEATKQLVALTANHLAQLATDAGVDAGVRSLINKHVDSVRVALGSNKTNAEQLIRDLTMARTELSTLRQTLENARSPVSRTIGALNEQYKAASDMLIEYETLRAASERLGSLVAGDKSVTEQVEQLDAHQRAKAALDGRAIADVACELQKKSTVPLRNEMVNMVATECKFPITNKALENVSQVRLGSCVTALKANNIFTDEVLANKNQLKEHLRAQDEVLAIHKSLEQSLMISEALVDESQAIGAQLGVTNSSVIITVNSLQRHITTLDNNAARGREDAKTYAAEAKRHAEKVLEHLATARENVSEAQRATETMASSTSANNERVRTLLSNVRLEDSIAMSLAQMIREWSGEGGVEDDDALVKGLRIVFAASGINGMISLGSATGRALGLAKRYTAKFFLGTPFEETPAITVVKIGTDLADAMQAFSASAIARIPANYLWGGTVAGGVIWLSISAAFGAIKRFFVNAYNVVTAPLRYVTSKLFNSDFIGGALRFNGHQWYARIGMGLATTATGAAAAALVTVAVGCVAKLFMPDVVTGVIAAISEMPMGQLLPYIASGVWALPPILYAAVVNRMRYAVFVYLARETALGVSGHAARMLIMSSTYRGSGPASLDNLEYARHVAKVKRHFAYKIAAFAGTSAANVLTLATLTNCAATRSFFASLRDSAKRGVIQDLKIAKEVAKATAPVAAAADIAREAIADVTNAADSVPVVESMTREQHNATSDALNTLLAASVDSQADNSTAVRVVLGSSKSILEAVPSLMGGGVMRLAYM